MKQRSIKEGTSNGRKKGKEKKMNILLIIAGLLSQQTGAFMMASNPKPAVVSWYNRGLHTANGEKFDPQGFTAAHKTLEMGTKLLVFNKKTNVGVVVRINDRGPFPKGRDIDITEGVAEYLGVKEQGVSTLVYQVLPADSPQTPRLQIRDTLKKTRMAAASKPAAASARKNLAARSALPALKFPIVPP